MELLWSGTLRKMRVEATEPVTYHLTDGFFDTTKRSPDCELNSSIGRILTIDYSGNIQCVECGRKTRKSFNQGHCFPCMRSLPQTDICIIKPELCHYFETDNPCRDDDFAQSQCFQPHVLYTALTSGVKVGITRKVNVPIRWMDQGAVEAIPLAELPSRREVGLVEVELAKSFGDKTHWASMLKTERPEIDLSEAADAVLAALGDMNVSGVLPQDQRIVYRFTYPVTEYPEKVKAHNLEKTPSVSGRLMGIKGQYLILDTGVINLRKYTGYQVEISVS